MAAFDALTTAAVIEELRAALVGGRVQDVVQPDRYSVGVEIYAHHRRRYLLLSVEPQTARVHLVDERLRRGVETPSPLLLLLRKYVQGAILETVSQPPFERVIHLRFAHPEYGLSLLIAEIMGRLSNLILVDRAGIILDSLKRVGPQMSRVRLVLPGGFYQPPPPQDKLRPDQLTPTQLDDALSRRGSGTPLWRALVEAIAGLSPQAARELTARVTGRAEADVSVADPLRLKKELEILWAPLRTGEWEPCVVGQGETIIAYAPYRLTHLGPARPVASISQAIALYHGQGHPTDPYAGLRAAVAQEIMAARMHLERQRTALQRQQVNPREIQRLREAGEWILALSSQIQAGQESLTIEPGTASPWRIELDPRLSPAENAQSYFARYRKAQRAAEEIPQRLQKVEHDLAYLEQLALDLEMAASQPEIAAVREALAAAGYLHEQPRHSAPPPGPIKVISPDGFTILVGRNSRQNDELTFRTAAPDDLWLHARGVPGAHVIICCQGRPIPPTTIQRAAELAAYYSAARDEPEVIVSIVPRRRVRRQPGGHPGQVLYNGEKTVRVRARP
jgi:predicted ribosome quality control (RQC) complex YloA/Tae2 family protein